MGNKIQQKKYLQKNISKQDLISITKNHFMIRQILIYSSDQHQNLLQYITKFKQSKSPYILSIIDSHSIKNHHLCSIITYLYVLFQKPTMKFTEYVKKSNRILDSNEAAQFLIGCIKAAQELHQLGHKVQRLNPTLLFVKQDTHQNLIPKIMSPVFAQNNQQTHLQQGTFLSKIVDMILPIIDNNCPILQRFINQFKQGEISKQDFNLRLSELSIKMKKDNKKIKLIGIKSKKDRISMISNTSSLMVDRQDKTNYLLKDFYQNQSDSQNLSLISQNQHIQQDSIHNFPKRYIKSKSFKKNIKSNIQQLQKYNSNNITRDHSIKEYYMIQSSQNRKQNSSFNISRNFSVLQSAKLTQSKAQWNN